MGEGKAKIEQTREEKLENLSEDVLVEILARLPVKSLMRFKCVCKSLYSFISDPAFIRKHFIHYTNNPDNFGHLLVVGERHRLQRNAYSLISSHDDNLSNQLARRGIPTKLETTLFKDFVATDNEFFRYLCHGFGIVCIKNIRNGNIALWNPTTREFRIIPELPEPIRIPTRIGTICPPYIYCGLGFDSIHDDYKLVHFGYQWIYDDDYYVEELVTLYKFSTSSWRALDVKFKGKPWPNYQTPAYINGFPWWLAMEDDNPAVYDDGYGYDFIASFDVNAEIFKYYQLPECCRSFYEDHYNLIQLHSHVALCICAQGPEWVHDSFDIWLMEELGAEVIWTKIFSMEPAEMVKRVVGFWPSSNILVMQLHSNQLMLYDITTSKTLHFELEVPTGLNGSNVHVFCDSLVHVGGQY